MHAVKMQGSVSWKCGIICLVCTILPVWKCLGGVLIDLWFVIFIFLLKVEELQKSLSMKSQELEAKNALANQKLKQMVIEILGPLLN